MERLTINKDVSEMSMMELAHNSCYVENHCARYRDYDTDIDARKLTIKLLEKHTDIPNEFTCDEDFDNFMSDSLQYGTDNIIGLIAAFYKNIWAMANLRERLGEYEDLEEQGLLLKLPCKVGDMFFCIWMNKGQNPIQKMQVKKIEIHERKGMVFQMEFVSNRGCLFRFYADDFGKTVFLARAEAEEALREMNGTEV